MTNYSVRKPYTVFVSVVAIIVFGIISYLRMTPDLLPNMDYPYVVVVTTYPGAAPEKVEAVVTKPMEQVMATLNDIKSLQSTSAENYGMLLLEFEQETNMDSAMVDILQAVQRLTGAWDDTVGTPTIIRINPNMIPVMVAAVDSSTMDRYALARFAQNTLIPAIEGTTGLASVSAGGLVERTLTVKVTDEKLDALNERVAEAIDRSLDEARKQLEDAQHEIDESREKVEAGTAQLQSAPAALSDSMEQKSNEVSELMEEARELASQIAAARATRDALEGQLLQSQQDEERLRQEIAELDADIARLEGEKAVYGAVVGGAFDEMDGATSVRDLGLDEGTVAALEERSCYNLEAARLQYSLTDAQLSVRRTEREARVTSLEVTEAQTLSLQQQVEQADELIEQLETASAGQLESLTKLQAQLEELPSQMLSGITSISLAGGQLGAAQSALTAAQQQLDQAVTTLEEQLQNAMKTADMHVIVTLDMVTSLLRAQDFDMPAGYVYDEKGQSVIVTVGEGIHGLAELEALPLFDPGIDGFEPVLLRDVAEVILSDNAGEIYATLNGNDGLLLMCSKQSNYATAKVSDNLRKTFRELEDKYEGISFTALMDQGDYIYLIRDSILSSLGFGVLFSVLVLLLFLRDWRPTVITLFSIPVSLMATLTMMYFANVSINMMSLSGLAISVGMLVDNSVVVIENTYRLRSLGESTMKSAVSGARQVGGAVAASTLTTVCVFVPIAFVSGLTRELFTDMILTLSFALIASLAVAMTLVPALAGLLLEKARTPKPGLLSRLMGSYRKTVLWAVGHKAVVILLAIALLAGSAWMVLDRGFTFMPNMEMEQMMVTLTMPEGSSFEETAAMADLAAERMMAVPGVATVGGSIGESYGMNLDMFNGGEADVSFYVLMEEGGPKASAVARAINEACADLDCEVVADANSLMSNMLSAITGSGVTVRVYANDLDVLRTTADAVAERMRGVEGVESVAAGEEEPTAEIHFTVDKARAAAHGLTVAQVFLEVNKALTGSSQVMDFVDGEDTYTLFVELSGKDEITPEYIRGLEFTVTKQDGTEETVTLSSIALSQDTKSLTTIHRLDQRRYLDVTAQPAEGYNITKLTDAVEAALTDMEIDSGAELKFSGERESILDALKQLSLLLIVGVLLVYLVMVGQFQNLKAPFIVMFTIPLAFTGGFLALLIMGMELNILSMLGMIMLVGIIVNNGIVLVDYINQLRLEGMERRAAIGEAAVTRLRPILMTSITTVLGLLVMALGQNEATSMIQPLAVTCIGGLVYATFMTLYVVPVMYDIFSKKELYQVKEEDLVLSDK